MFSPHIYLFSFLAVEIFEDVVQHAKGAMTRWKGVIRKPVPRIEWIHGNGLHINPDKGEAVIGFDRIYVGASVEKNDLPKLANLLRPGGILVGPGMLLKVFELLQIYMHEYSLCDAPRLIISCPFPLSQSRMNY